MRRQLAPALRMVLAFTVLLGLAYPLALTGIAQTVFSSRADGSLVRVPGGEVVGSALLGQAFDDPGAFLARPSVAGENGYNPTASGASNLGPLNPELIAAVAERATAYRHVNGLPDGALVPVDAVTASGSGLDPHISVANARLQAPRVAAARGLPVAEVLDLVDEHTAGRDLGLFGEPGVNVLELNLALDAAAAAN